MADKIDPKASVPAAPATLPTKYRALVNWRYGQLYQMDQYHTLEDVPQEDIDKAVAAGYLEKVS